MEVQHIDQLYQRLEELIKERNHEHVIKTADQILQKKPTDERTQKCRLLALLKHEKFSVLANEYTTKGVPGTNSDEQQQLCYAYFLYGYEKYEDCLKYLAGSCSFQTLPFLLLQSQAQNKLQNYSKAAELYVNILKKFPKAEDYADILVNAIASAISSEEREIQEQVRVIAAEYGKNTKQQNQSREFVYNFGSLLGCLHEREAQAEQQRRFKALATAEDSDKQDEAMAALQSDYGDYQENKAVVGEDLEKKIKQYEEYLKYQLTDKNVKAVLENNLVVMRNTHKHEQYGDSLKVIDDAITGKYKQTPQQIAIFKLNKAQLLAIRGKIQEALVILVELEKSQAAGSATSFAQQLGIKFQILKAFALMKAKKEEPLAQFVAQLQTQVLRDQSASQEYRVEVFLLLAEIFKTQGNSLMILENFKMLLEAASPSDRTALFENEVLCCFILSVVSKIKEESAITLVQPVLEAIARNTHSPQILQYLGDIYSKSNPSVAVQIYQKLTEQFPKESAYHQRLAKIYSLTGEFSKAEALLQNIKFDLIEDYFELSKLESEIALSKIDTKPTQGATPVNSAAGNANTNPALTKKISKPLKKRVRYPKNFDPKNPGPLPNPERWLPKWERKDFKKKKGAFLNSRTQGSSAAAQDHTSTTKSFTSANSTSHKKVTENKKSNKKKNR